MNELPENTVGFNNTTLGPMTYRDLDEVDYSGPTKKLREQYKLLQEQLYAANMELKLRRVWLHGEENQWINHFVKLVEQTWTTWSTMQNQLQIK